MKKASPLQLIVSIVIGAIYGVFLAKIPTLIQDFDLLLILISFLFPIGIGYLVFGGINLAQLLVAGTISIMIYAILLLLAVPLTGLFTTILASLLTVFIMQHYIWGKQ